MLQLNNRQVVQYTTRNWQFQRNIYFTFMYLYYLHSFCALQLRKKKKIEIITIFIRQVYYRLQLLSLDHTFSLAALYYIQVLILIYNLQGILNTQQEPLFYTKIQVKFDQLLFINNRYSYIVIIIIQYTSSYLSNFGKSNRQLRQFIPTYRYIQ